MSNKKWFAGSNSQIVKNAALIYLWRRGGSSMDHQDTYCPSMASLPLPKCNNCITKYTGQVPDSLSREYIVFMMTRSLQKTDIWNIFNTFNELMNGLKKCQFHRPEKCWGIQRKLRIRSSLSSAVLRFALTNDCYKSKSTGSCSNKALLTLHFRMAHFWPSNHWIFSMKAFKGKTLFPGQCL